MNLPEKLAREIARVTELRARYAALDGTAGVNVKPAIHFMDQALESAKRAAGLDDFRAHFNAIKDLEGFEK